MLRIVLVPVLFVCLYFIDLIIVGYVLVSVYWRTYFFYNEARWYVLKVQCCPSVRSSTALIYILKHAAYFIAYDFQS